MLNCIHSKHACFRLIHHWNQTPLSGSSFIGITIPVQAHPALDNSWPGFTGALSGLATGRFAITLNAALSVEPAQLATPNHLLDSNALEEAPSFEAALELLSRTP